MFNSLVDRIKEYNSAVLGFSGGVDSSLVAYAAKAAKIPFICATVQTPLQTERELAQSAFFCGEYGIERKVITVDVLEIPEVRANPKNRCYYCKNVIFKRLLDLAEELGYETVLDGSNGDDSQEFRPGLKAKDELGVVSPLAELGFTKEDVRRISKEQGLPTWNLPSSPCLATRIPYGSALELQMIKAVEQAENVLLRIGAGNLRVRAHGDVARIEAEDIDKMYRLLDEQTINRIKACGFKFICLDMDGYKRGSFD